MAAIASKPRANKREMRTLTAIEVGRLALAAAGTRFEALLTVALACGARRGELLGARSGMMWILLGELSRFAGLSSKRRLAWRKRTPKSGKSRIVQLPETALEMLRRHYGAAEGRIGLGYIFPGDDAGNPWTSPKSVTDGFRALAKKAQLMGASFHTLRHTCASMLLAQGVHPKVVQEMLGHSTIAITMDLYSHATPSLQAEAATKLDVALKAALGPSTVVA